MNLGTVFIIEVPEEREADFIDLVKARIWNYPIVKKMPFGWALTSLDGAALTIPPGHSWPDFLKSPLVIRTATPEEESELLSRLNSGESWNEVKNQASGGVEL